jgi:3-deoxy-D-manno-octulosonic-acid transferase
MGGLFGFPLIIFLVLVSEKRRKTFPYRLGLAALPQAPVDPSLQSPEKRPVWIHALSVGEVHSAVALVKGLRRTWEQADLYFSVSTLTGFEVAEKQLKEDVGALFFFPYDVIFSVKQVVKKINPALVIIVETDIWPNFMKTMERRKIPVVLVNARLSDRSFSHYKRVSFFSKTLFNMFARICVQSGQDASHFKMLGVASEKLFVTGNIKFDQAVKPVSTDEKKRLKEWLRIDPRTKVLLAGSTHNGEEVILQKVFSRLKTEFSDFVLIVVPRDPKRARSVSHLFKAAGIDAVPVSALKNSVPGSSPDVMIVDTIGLLGRLYSLADITFVGGSLVACGGHNPLEPAAFSKPILLGPDMSDFRQISRMLLDAGGAIKIKDAESFYHCVSELLGNGEKSRAMGLRAFDVFRENKGALAKTLQAIGHVNPYQ